MGPAAASGRASRLVVAELAGRHRSRRSRRRTPSSGRVRSKRTSATTGIARNRRRRFRSASDRRRRKRAEEWAAVRGHAAELRAVQRSRRERCSTCRCTSTSSTDTGEGDGAGRRWHSPAAIRYKPLPGYQVMANHFHTGSVDRGCSRRAASTTSCRSRSADAAPASTSSPDGRPERRRTGSRGRLEGVAILRGRPAALGQALS